MMDRRTFVGAGAATLLAIPLGAWAQRGDRVPRLGLLTPGPTSLEAPFIDGMRDLGYIEGKNIVVQRRSADGDFARLPALAAELVKLQPDVIVAMVSAASIAASQATTTIPIVMVGVGDPVASGLVGNLSRPGGNVTGTSGQSSATMGKQVELIRQLLPAARRVTMLWNPANANFQQILLGEGLIAAARLRLLANIVQAGTPKDIDRAFETLKSDPPDALLVLQDPAFLANATRIVEAARALRLPTFSGTRSLVQAGILASYGSDLAAVARRAAVHVQKILKGAKPGDLPVELPTKFELVVNLKTAAALGVTVPPAVRARAEVIE
jgi:putative ABC transport system substrate-binding protein